MKRQQPPQGLPRIAKAEVMQEAGQRAARRAVADELENPPAVTVTICPGKPAPGQLAAWARFWRRVVGEAREGKP